MMGKAWALSDIIPNGLRLLAGTWSEDEFKRFEEAVAPLGEIDGELWK